MKHKTVRMTDVLALPVFAAFALCVLLVLLTAAGVYRDLVQSGEAAHTRRTAVQYITTRVRQAEQVEVADFDGCSALVIREETGGEVYLTRVYSYDGSLRELYCEETAGLKPADGEMILPAEEIVFYRDGSLLRVQIGEDQLLLDLPVGKKVGS